MCIIAVKKAGVDMIPYETIETMFDNNSDGAGYMYEKDGKVIIRKGFMTLGALKQSLKKLERKVDIKETPLVMHFRISTAGNVDEGNCHPYPVVAEKCQLRKRRYTTDLGMAHNGVISSYRPSLKSIYNDSQCFVSEVVSVFKDYDENFLKNKKVMKMIKNLIDSSKLAFLDKDGEITTVGDWIQDGEYMFSNTSYKQYGYAYNYTPTNKLKELQRDVWGYEYYGDQYDWDEEVIYPSKAETKEERLADYLAFEERLEEKLNYYEELNQMDLEFILNNYTETEDYELLKGIGVDENEECEYFEVLGFLVEIDYDTYTAFNHGYIADYYQIKEERETSEIVDKTEQLALF